MLKIIALKKLNNNETRPVIRKLFIRKIYMIIYQAQIQRGFYEVPVFSFAIL